MAPPLVKRKSEKLQLEKLRSSAPPVSPCAIFPQRPSHNSPIPFIDVGDVNGVEDDSFELEPRKYRTTEDNFDDLIDTEIAKGNKPHFRARFMTERVARLLHQSQATGNVGDLTKVTTLGYKAQQPKENMNEDSDGKVDDDSVQWKEECKRLEEAEREQLAFGDYFWGLINEWRDEQHNLKRMEEEDEHSNAIRLNLKLGRLHRKWDALEKVARANHDRAKASREERARKEYMKTFNTSVDSSEIICHQWATRPTLMIRKEVEMMVGDADTVGGSSLESSSVIVQPKIGDGDSIGEEVGEEEVWPRPVSGGYKINTRSNNSWNINPENPEEDEEEDGGNSSNNNSNTAVIATNNNAVTSSPANPFGTFHFAGNKNRGKKIIILKSENFFSQDPFERFSAHKIRAKMASGNFSGGSSGVDTQGMLQSSAVPLKERIEETFNTYMNASKELKESRGRVLSSSRGGKKTRVSSKTSGGNRGSAIDGLEETQQMQTTYEVKLGQFHGVTVPGGGKRRSVMNPVLPKSKFEVEKDQLRLAYYQLEEVFEDSRDNITVETLADSFLNNAKFKSCLLNTIYWPFIKRKDWTMLYDKFKDRQDGIIGFEDFYNFSKDLYREERVEKFRVRNISKFKDTSHLRDDGLEMREVGERVEGRIRYGPTWLQGTIREVDEEKKTYTIHYDNVTKLPDGALNRSKRKSRRRNLGTMAVNIKATNLSRSQIRELSERQLTGFVYDLLKVEAGEEEGDVISKKAAVEVINREASSASSSGGGSSTLSAMVNRSSAILALVRLPEIRMAFDNLLERNLDGIGIAVDRLNREDSAGESVSEGESLDVDKSNKNVAKMNKGAVEYDSSTIDTITRGTFVEFFIGVSDVLKFNNIKL